MEFPRLGLSSWQICASPDFQLGSGFAADFADDVRALTIGVSRPRLSESLVKLWRRNPPRRQALDLSGYVLVVAIDRLFLRGRLGKKRGRFGAVCARYHLATLLGTPSLASMLIGLDSGGLTTRFIAAAGIPASAA